ncbi:hypothetical protein EV424DRAFT_1355273 [Suillus variegatus]|nr:hypothetical protein EV424DRAFT_1355273 [Suillus variegatus]
MGPWSAGPYHMGYYALSEVTEFLFNSSLVQDSDQYPTVSHTSLIVPTRWKQVAIYTDQDLVSRKVFQINPASTLFSSNHSSSASVFEENKLFMSTMSSLSEGHWMSDVNSLVLDAPSNLAASASGNILDQTTFLDSEAIPSTIAATNSTLSLTHYQQGAVSAEQKAFMKSIKTFAISFVDNPDREHLGGYNIQNIDVTTTKYIKMLTGLTSANGVVTSITYDYNTFLEHLLSVICAMLVMVLRTCFPGEVPNSFAKEVFMDKEAQQLALFRSFRNSGVPQAIELNTWLTTPNGWRHDLEQPERSTLNFQKDFTCTSHSITVTVHQYNHHTHIVNPSRKAAHTAAVYTLVLI